MDNPISKNKLLIAALAALTLTTFLFMRAYAHHDTVVVFCDVGQGDGAYIRINNKIDMLIDGGRDGKVLSCLGRHMPFYDRTIELVLLSHPQEDHYGGLLEVVSRYKIRHFIASPVGNPAESFQSLVKKLGEKGVRIQALYAGDSVQVADARLRFMWPDSAYVRKNTTIPQLASTSPHSASGPYDRYFKESSLDPNNFSQVFELSQGDKSILFTGDVATDILPGLSRQAIGHVDILKTPHHGSKNGLSSTFLKLADPSVAVISAGKRNSYGHPSKAILDLLRAAKVQIRRTDLEGDIVYRFRRPN